VKESHWPAKRALKNNPVEILSESASMDCGLDSPLNAKVLTRAKGPSARLGPNVLKSVLLRVGAAQAGINACVTEAVVLVVWRKVCLVAFHLLYRMESGISREQVTTPQLIIAAMKDTI